MKKFIFIILLVSLISCSSLPLDFLKTDKPSIEANANIGKNVNQDKSVIKVDNGNKTKQEADNISNDTKYSAQSIKQITQNVPTEYLLLMVLLAGWAIPDPKKCLYGVREIIKELYNGLLVTPLKGISDFILKLFSKNKE